MHAKKHVPELHGAKWSEMVAGEGELYLVRAAHSR
jgi:hypothetical protein